MTTYAELQDKVSRTLQDPDNQTFDLQTVKDMIAAGWAEVSLISPQRFIEDLTPVDDQVAYLLQADDFPDGNDDIRPVSVEVWDGGPPERPLKWIEPASSHVTGLTYSEAGWQFWGGYLNLPNRWVAYLNGHSADYFLRVRGYAPWPLPNDQQALAGTATGTAATNLVTLAGHGLLANDPVRFISLVGGAGIGISTTYYVIASGLTADAFKFSATLGGAEFDFTTDITAGSVVKVIPVDADVIPFTAGVEEALVIYCYIEALRRLIGNRALFTQWQTRSNNTDVTPAALMNDLNIAQEEWRRKSRAILVLRETP